MQKRKRDGYKNLSFFYCRYTFRDIYFTINLISSSFLSRKKKKKKYISLQINSLTSVIRILAVQFPGYLFKHILVAVEPANSRAATLHLPSPRRSPTILGRINPRLPGNRNRRVSRIVTNNHRRKMHFSLSFQKHFHSLFPVFLTTAGQLSTTVISFLPLSFFSARLRGVGEEGFLFFIFFFVFLESFHEGWIDDDEV